MAPVYKTFNALDEIPVKSDPITVVVKDPDDNSSEELCMPVSLLVTTMIDGKLQDDEEYFDPSSIDVIPKEMISGEVFVQEDAVSSFEHLCEFSDIYDECNGNYDMIAEKLDEKIQEIALERELEDESES